MAGTLGRLGLDLPVLAAPMAGGATTESMVVAAADAGSLGFVPGGYLPAARLADKIGSVAARTPRFGVNLFVPNPVPISSSAYEAYAGEIGPDAAALGVDPAAVPLREDDDDWSAKIDVLLAQHVPIVSFTFGIPDVAVLDALRRVGSLLAQTVTTSPEAEAAAHAGVDMLVVQASAAGGHSGTLRPDRPLDDLPLPDLVQAVHRSTGLPIIGAGGVSGRDDVRAALAAGADAVAVGTLLLLAQESGASETHRKALRDLRFRETTITQAFTGRPARGLRNAFIDAHSDAPLGYPAIHHLTTPMRRTAATTGDADRLHLWAGTGYRNARVAPTAEILRDLAKV